MDRPWTQEPDNRKFVVNGLHCEIIRHRELGHLCGYVDLPKEHQLHGAEYDDVSVEVHGGWTYAEPNEDAWRIGFACAHLYDLVPWSPNYAVTGATYKNMRFVVGELANAAIHLSIGAFEVEPE